MSYEIFLYNGVVLSKFEKLNKLLFLEFKTKTFLYYNHDKKL